MEAFWLLHVNLFIQKDKRRSLQPHMEKCVFVGYPSGYKGWKFYNPTTQKYIICERAEFDERVFPGLAKYKTTSPVDLQGPYSPAISTAPDPVLDLGGDGDEDGCIPAPLPSAHIPLEKIPLADDLPPPPIPVIPPAIIPALIPAQLPIAPHAIPPAIPPVLQPPLCRTSRVSRPPGKWWKAKPPIDPPVIWSDDEEKEEDKADDEQQVNSVSGSEPCTFKHAMNGPQSDRWKEVAALEYNTLIENGTWEIIDLPPGQKAIGSGWVFKVKHNQDGSVEHFKAHLVAKGYSQRPGLDYNESFAPTFRPATLRIIMALAAVEDLELR